VAGRGVSPGRVDLRIQLSREALTAVRVDWSTAPIRPHPHAGQAGGIANAGSTSAVNSKWELMLNMLLSGEFNFDQFGLLISDCVGADFKLRAHFRNSMQIGMSLKASPQGKRECRVAQRRR
jgi:hypothetical protein